MQSTGKGTYCTVPTAFQKLGGDKAAMAGAKTYVEKAKLMGGHWTQKNSLADMCELFWMETGCEEIVEKAWATKDIAELGKSKRENAPPSESDPAPPTGPKRPTPHTGSAPPATDPSAKVSQGHACN